MADTASHASQPMDRVFQGTTLRDQYDQPFNPSEVLGNGPAIVVFGYGDCPRCTLITRTVAAIQKQLEAEGRHIPIVVVSMKPETDGNPSTDNNTDDKRMRRRRYITSGYYALGVRQFSGDPAHLNDREGAPENIEDLRHEAFAAGASIPQRGRLLHIVRPASAAQAVEIQNRVMGPNSTAPGETHTPMITLFNNGQFVRHYPGLQDGVAPDSIEDSDIEGVSRHAARLAPIVAGDIKNLPALNASPTPAPSGLTNAALWNFGLPVVAGVVAAAFSGGLMSFKSLIFGALAAGGVSVLTQWVTGTGLFAVTPETPSVVPGGTPAPPHGQAPQPHTSIKPPNYEEAYTQASQVRPLDHVRIAPTDALAVPAQIPVQAEPAMIRSC